MQIQNFERMMCANWKPAQCTPNQSLERGQADDQKNPTGFVVMRRPARWLSALLASLLVLPPAYAQEQRGGLADKATCSGAAVVSLNVPENSLASPKADTNVLDLLLRDQIQEQAQTDRELAIAIFGAKAGSDIMKDGVNRNNPTGLFSREQMADPVIMPTGNFHDRSFDLSRIGGSTDFALIRSYNSMDTWYTGPFGKGWRCPWDIALEEAKNGMWVVFGDGLRYFFTFMNNQYVAPPGCHYRLSVDENLVYRLSTPQAEIYEFADREHMKVTALQKGGKDALVFVYMPFTGLLKEVRDAFGNQLRFHYNAQRRIVRAADSAGRTVQYTYDALGHLISFRDAMGRRTHYAYDLLGNMLRKIGPSGIDVLTQYDLTHRVIAQGNAARPDLYRFVYDDQYKVVHALRGADKTIYHYDDQYRIVKEVLPGGLILRREFDEAGNLVAFQRQAANARSRVWKFQYDQAGNLIVQTDPMGHSTRYIYAPQTNKLTGITDPMGNTARFVYDARGHLSCRIDALGNKTRFVMTPLNQPLRVDYPDGSYTQYVYDARGRLATTTLRGVKGAALMSQRFRYDALGNIAAVQDPAGAVTRNVYDTDGNIIRTVRGTKKSPVTSEYTWDAAGNLLSAKDTNGRVTRYAYWPDWHGSLKEIVFPDGNRMRFEVDDYGRLLGTTSPDGNTLRTAYDSSDRPVQQWKNGVLVWQGAYDAFGDLVCETVSTSGGRQQTTYGYDRMGRLMSVTDAIGNSTRFTRDPLGRITARILPNGANLSYRYDALGNFVAETDALGKRHDYRYDAMGRIVQINDPDRAKTDMAYHPAGWPVQITDAMGNKTRIWRDKAGRFLRSRSPAGVSPVTRYDALGQPRKILHPSGLIEYRRYDKTGNAVLIRLATESGRILRSWRYRYDAHDRLLEAVNAAGHAARYAYDALGRIASQADAMGHATSYSYDALGFLAGATDAMGHSIAYRRDALGRLLQFRDPEGHSTSFDYDAGGYLQRITDPLGHITGYERDSLGRVTAIVNALGRKTAYAYDCMGNIASVLAPDGTQKHYRYDAMGRLIQDQLGDRAKEQFRYDAAGNLVEKTDALHHKTAYRYDRLGRLKSTQDPMGGKTRFRYDRLGRLIAVQDAAGAITRYAYNRLDQVLAKTDPLGRKIQYAYDANGRLTRKTDAMGRRSLYRYDAAGRLIQILHPGKEQVAYRYDKSGRLLEAVTQDGHITRFHYDALGRVVQEYNVAKGRKPVLRKNTYDALGNRLRTQLDGDTPIAYEYDAFNRLRAIVEKPSPMAGLLGRSMRTEFAYDALGRRSQITLPNAATTRYAYDAAHRVREITSLNKEQQVLQKFLYRYDAVGNPIEKTRIRPDSEERISYAYDDNGRLIREAVTSFAPSPSSAGGPAPRHARILSYAYDGVGNRLSMSVADGNATVYQYNRAHELIAETHPDGNRIAYAYDPAGNLIEKQAGDEATKYYYSPNGLVSSVLAGASRIDYQYDPLGRRIAKEIIAPKRAHASPPAVDTETYAYDGLTLARQDDIRYLYAPQTDELLGTIPGARSNQSQYFLSDNLGSVTAIIGEDQKIQRAFSFDAFGNPHAEIPGHDPISRREMGIVSQEFPDTKGLPPIFAGHRLDPETGTYHARARHYDPAMGRFISPDPLHSVPDPTANLLPGANPYTYVRNNPARFVDPLGLLETQRNRGPDPFNISTDPGPSAARQGIPRTPSVAGTKSIGQISPGFGLQNALTLAQQAAQQAMILQVSASGTWNQSFGPGGRGIQMQAVKEWGQDIYLFRDEHSARVNDEYRIAWTDTTVYAKGETVVGINIYSSWDKTGAEAARDRLTWRPNEGWKTNDPPQPPGIKPGEFFVPGPDLPIELSKAFPGLIQQLGVLGQPGSTLTGPNPWNLLGGGVFHPEAGGAGTISPPISLPGTGIGTGGNQDERDRRNQPPGGVGSERGTQATFWSGGEAAKKAASDWAKKNNAQILEMTPQGKQLEQSAKELDWLTEARPKWIEASKDFAELAVGDVHVFQNAKGVSLQSVWRQAEYPALKNNRNVSNIIYHIVDE